MSENETKFRDKHQELEHLIQELKQTKDLLKDIASRMTQIERHVTRAFIPLPVNSRSSRNLRSDRSSKPSGQATITEQQALAFFDELKALSVSNRNELAVQKLEQLSISDLKLVAHELGLTFKSKPSKRNLISRIQGRLNESLLLSKNVNVTQPRSATNQQRGLEVEGDELTQNPHDNEATRRSLSHPFRG